MYGPQEEKAHEFAASVDAFILTYAPTPLELRVVMETEDLDGVGASGRDREEAFTALLARAEAFDWSPSRASAG